MYAGRKVCVPACVCRFRPRKDEWLPQCHPEPRDMGEVEGEVSMVSYHESPDLVPWTVGVTQGLRGEE